MYLVYGYDRSLYLFQYYNGTGPLFFKKKKKKRERPARTWRTRELATSIAIPQPFVLGFGHSIRVEVSFGLACNAGLHRQIYAG